MEVQTSLFQTKAKERHSGCHSDMDVEEESTSEASKAAFFIKPSRKDELKILGPGALNELVGTTAAHSRRMSGKEREIVYECRLMMNRRSAARRIKEEAKLSELREQRVASIRAMKNAIAKVVDEHRELEEEKRASTHSWQMTSEERETMLKKRWLRTKKRADQSDVVQNASSTAKNMNEDVKRARSLLLSTGDPPREESALTKAWAEAELARAHYKLSFIQGDRDRRCCTRDKAGKLIGRVIKTYKPTYGRKSSLLSKKKSITAFCRRNYYMSKLNHYSQKCTRLFGKWETLLDAQLKSEKALNFHLRAHGKLLVNHSILAERVAVYRDETGLSVMLKNRAARAVLTTLIGEIKEHLQKLGEKKSTVKKRLEVAKERRACLMRLGC